jgi:filamentous hemagglutinin family protein
VTRPANAPQQIGVSLAALVIATAVHAAPTAGVVRAGSATISSAGATTTINQASDRAVIDWGSFGIASGETVTFAQPGPSSATLNRVTGAQASVLEGTLNANGQVYLINPNGILISKGATIDTGSFVAATANIATTDFMLSTAAANGRYPFTQVTPASAAGTIVNAGTITAADGGLVALVAPAVRNSGIITAHLGKIELASANIFTLDLYGDDLVRLGVSDQLAQKLTDVTGTPVTSQVSVDGQLQADGGKVVLLSVPAASGVVDSAINLSGVIRAQSVGTGASGEILLSAVGGDIAVSGSLDVSGQTGVLAGGTIQAFGANVHLLPTAVVNASGAGGGGFVALGGRLTEGTTTTETATTTVDYGAQVAACGDPACTTDGSGGTGAGGTVRLYSAHGTTLDGKVNISSAQGAVAGTSEVLSDLGTTTLGTMSQIIANTGTGQQAGFAVVIGYDLSVASGVRMDMRDYAGNANGSATRRLYDQSDPTLRTYVQSNDPNLTFVQTSDPIVFHAYDPSAQDPVTGYVSKLPARNDPSNGIEASGYTTPVGTVRPDGGAPTTLTSTSADAITPIPVSLTTPASPGGAPGQPFSGSGSPSGGTSSSGTPSTSGGSATPSGGAPSSGAGSPSDAGSPPAAIAPPPDPAGLQGAEVVAQISESANLTGRDTVQPGTSDRAPLSDRVASVDAPAMPLVAGGPGVEQAAELGPAIGVPGAMADIFRVNYQILTPAGAEGDARVADYLCRTPFAGNACAARRR